MNEPIRSYPLQLVSRSLPSTRTNKIRLSWFVVGVAFGVGCASALSPLVIAVPQQLVQAEDTMPMLAPAAGVPDTQPVILSSDKPAEVPRPAANMYPLDVSLKVGNGDTLITMLTGAGVPNDEAYTVVQAIRKVYNLRKLGIGQDVVVHLDKDPATPDKPIITSLKLPMSLTSTLEVTRGSDGFDVKKIDKPVERKVSRAGGTITSSLYETGMASGLPASLIADLITAYSYDLDFQRDIKSGNSIDVLFERMETKEGNVAGYGDVLFAELNLDDDRSLKLYRYTDATGFADFYNEKGESVRKALLKTPINGARITSRFGMRNHPILGYTKMHRGVDFGAPTGTPIYAAGDGTVEFAGTKNGYGNYVRIRHNNVYASAYGHISRFATGMKAGKRVKQGQVIAYVGSTGNSTGPHLHYEIIAGNIQVNPRSVKFKTGNTLKGKELAAFKQTMEHVQAMLESTPRAVTTVAMAE